MYGTHPSRRLEHAAQEPRSALSAPQEADVPAVVGDGAGAGDGAGQGGHPAPARAWAPPSANGDRDDRGERRSGEGLPFGSAWSSGGPAYAATQNRRLPWLFAVLALHGLFLAVFLLHRRTVAVTAPEPLQVQIIAEEPHNEPVPPPRPPVLVAPAQIVVPAPIVSIPEPAAVVTTVQPVQSRSRATLVSHAPPAPAKPVSAPQFDAAYLHNPAPKYPLQARRLHEQGTVLLRVQVSAAGGALQVLVEHSSGWPALDASALDVVRRWRFEPARRGRDPVAAWVLVPIEFDLRS